MSRNSDKSDFLFSSVLLRAETLVMDQRSEANPKCRNLIYLNTSTTNKRHGFEEDH